MLMESAAPTLARKLLRVALKPGDSSDRDLLTRFSSSRDEDAFAELVRRHGRMVLAVARRVTGHQQDAEDAFQATFLVLARRATQIKQPEQLANWLYGVAYRTALEARAARRRVMEHSVSALPESFAMPPPDDATDLRRVIDEEMACLPDKYRSAVVLCDLEGLPRTEAAARLKIPEGTLSSRLAHARKVLAVRLTRRGITSTSSGIAALLAREATGSALPRELVLLTARAAAQVTAGGVVPPNLVSPSVSHLAEGAMKIMLANRLRLSITTGVLACGLLALGAFGLAQTGVQNSPRPAPDVNQPLTNSNFGPSNQASPHSTTTKIIARGIEDDDVPYGSLPTQAVVRIEEGKLIIRQRIAHIEPVSHPRGNESVTSYQQRSQVNGQTIADTSDVTVFDMKGNRLLPKVWKEKLKTDCHVLLAFDGKLPHPRELAIFKDDTLMLILPTNPFTQFTVPPTHAPTVNGYPPGMTPQTYYEPQTTYVPRTTLVPSTNYPPPQPTSEVYPPYVPRTTPVPSPNYPPPPASEIHPPSVRYDVTPLPPQPVTPPRAVPPQDVPYQVPPTVSLPPQPASQPPTSTPTAQPAATPQPIPTPTVTPPQPASTPVPQSTNTPRPIPTTPPQPTSTPPSAPTPIPEPTTPQPATSPAPRPTIPGVVDVIPAQPIPSPLPLPNTPQPATPPAPQPITPQPSQPTIPNSDVERTTPPEISTSRS
jgi:RNA polymerase sigma factor (sigma-70 family)